MIRHFALTAIAAAFTFFAAPAAAQDMSLTPAVENVESTNEKRKAEGRDVRTNNNKKHKAGQGECWHFMNKGSCRYGNRCPTCRRCSSWPARGSVGSQTTESPLRP